jgi:hypothetical protein
LVISLGRLGMNGVNLITEVVCFTQVKKDVVDCVGYYLGIKFERRGSSVEIEQKMLKFRSFQ